MDGRIFGRKDVVQILLDKGANPNAADEYGRTPLHCAGRGADEYNRSDTGVVLLMLVRNGANFQVTDSGGRGPGKWSVLEDHYEKKPWLLITVVSSNALARFNRESRHQVNKLCYQ